MKMSNSESLAPEGPDASQDGLSVLSAEPVGVWRAYMTHEELALCGDKPTISALPEETSTPGEGVNRPGGVTLTACLIARNEERHLATCLASVKDLVDEIVLVDTGSTDRTRQIARQFGARVFEFRWTGDFSAARNEAKRRAHGRWILQIDPDETLHPYSRSRLTRCLSDPKIGGYFLLFRRRPRLTRNWQLKLYRNYPSVWCKGVIHENVTPLQVRSAAGLGIAAIPILVDHSGYEGDLHWKHQRNLPLLLRRLEENPDDPSQAHIWGHLSEVYEALGKRDLSSSAADRALRLIRNKGKPHPVDCTAYLRILSRRVFAGEGIEGLFEEACELFPENLQLLWIGGRWLMKQGNYRQAMPQFLELLRRGQTGDYSNWVGYDQRLFGTFSYRSIAACCFHLQQYDEHRRYLRLAQEPDTPAGPVGSEG